MRRRSLLLSLAPMSREIRREVFRASPRPGVAVMAFAWYTDAKRNHLMSIEQHWTRSDTIDVAYVRHSRDHGRTWTAPVERKTGERTAQGMLRRHLRGGWVDPTTKKFIEIWNEGVLPSDDPLEGQRQWRIQYRIGDRGDVQIAKQAGHTDDHPFPTIWRGKNSIMLGDSGYNVLTLRDGTMLLPVTVAPLDAQGKLYNPTGGYTYHDAAVLRGRWRGPNIDWEMSAPIQGDPARVTRGMDEPTIARLNDRQLILVLRGSNDKRPGDPAYRWVSYSSDEGRTWSAPEPWTYTGGERFFSPSSCSQLVAHSSGRLYWLGNITPENPRGNRPRYPFVMGEVDRASGKLIRASVRIVDDKQPDDDPLLTLSNFYAREDRETKEIALHMTRLFALNTGWRGDAFLYRIPCL